jgi:hypothetical protein
VVNEDGGGLLVRCGHHLEQHVSTGVVYQRVSDHIEDEDFHIGVATQLKLEPFVMLSRFETFEYVACCHAENVASDLPSALVQGQAQVNLS